MKRKSQTAEPPDRPAVAHLTHQLDVGLDIGFGVTKAVTASTTIAFPSAYGASKDIKYTEAREVIRRDFPGDQLTDEEGNWFVGELALHELPPGELIQLRGRMANQDEWGYHFRQRMARVALGKLLNWLTAGDVVQVRIGTGLPVDHMREADLLKQALLGQHQIVTDQTAFIAQVVDVSVMPQPFGTVYSQMFTNEGQINARFTAKEIGVCDVGRYTIDAAVNRNGKYIDALSGSVESGVSLAQERIANALEKQHGDKFSYRVIDQVLRTRVLRIRGHETDYGELVEDALEPLRLSTLTLLGEKWKTAALLDTILLCGGGAELVYDAVNEQFPQTVLMPNAQFTNAIGYYNYAMWKSRKH